MKSQTLSIRQESAPGRAGKFRDSLHKLLWDSLYSWSDRIFASVHDTLKACLPAGCLYPNATVVVRSAAVQDAILAIILLKSEY